MQAPITVAVPGLDQYPDGAKSDPAAEGPCQYAKSPRQPVHLQRFTRRKGIEITREDVEGIFSCFYRLQQRIQLANATPLGPVRMYRTKVHAEDRERRQFYLEERSAYSRRLMPGMFHRPGAAQEAE